ncbi:hypothetical protein H7169_02160 [Candidatus Gracilibacteria bacterium]|nr:hypothetical protein [Candidatus Gracilibacteria bacterium]
MLRIIFTKNTIIRDTCVASLSLGRNSTEASPDFIVYERGDWVLIFSKEFDIDVVLPTILDNWDPDRIYLPYLGRSVDMMHEIGDVILPNVFIPYAPQKETDTTENEITSISGARFLEIYDEQKDYYVEDYGLSVGGIVVEKTPNNPELNTDLMMTYEADIYIEDSLDAAYTVTSGDLIPALIICGIIDGKSSKNDSGTPEQVTIRNMLTTIRLTEEEGGVV